MCSHLCTACLPYMCINICMCIHIRMCTHICMCATHPFPFALVVRGWKIGALLKKKKTENQYFANSTNYKAFLILILVPF